MMLNHRLLLTQHDTQLVKLLKSSSNAPLGALTLFTRYFSNILWIVGITPRSVEFDKAYEKQKLKISKLPHFDFSNLLSAFSESKSSDGN